MKFYYEKDSEHSSGNVSPPVAFAFCFRGERGGRTMRPHGSACDPADVVETATIIMLQLINTCEKSRHAISPAKIYSYLPKVTPDLTVHKSQLCFLMMMHKAKQLNTTTES